MADFVHWRRQRIGVGELPNAFPHHEVPSDIFSAVCERLLEKWSNRVSTMRNATGPSL